MGRFLVPVIAVAVLYYVWKNPDGWAGLTRLVRPILLLALALLYLRIPFDIIPDTLPIGLLDDLAILLAAIYFGRQPSADADAEQEEPVSKPAASRDPHDILGVARGASQQEITAAYREKMKQYHPDRVATLGEELRQVAHDKSVEIQQAYDRLRSKG